MFEIEVQHSSGDPGELPPAVLAQFTSSRVLSHLAHTIWEEHCTECAWPTCYTTCDLYSPRNDGNCRRTVDGFSPIAHAPVLGGHVVRVRFKQWCSLSTTCTVMLQPVERVVRAERRLNALSAAAVRLPNLGRAIGRPGLPSRIVRRLKRRSVRTLTAGMEHAREPDCFLMEVYNPAPRAIELSLVIAPHGSGPVPVPFKQMIRLTHGFQRIRIPFAPIKARLAGAREAYVSINPNILSAEEEGLTLYLGALSFAVEPVAVDGRPAIEKIKVAVWDLDNTLWSGILVEDGPGNVTLRRGVREVIVALDARGIVNSVASKNDPDTAMAELERLGLRDYFVFPMIGWGPKSDSVRNIVRAFNVGEDTVAFIDDQLFEREEVRASNPKVRVYTHEQACELLGLEEFDVPVTDEARQRRRFYQSEEIRQEVLQETPGDYLAFLRQSEIRVHIAKATVGQIERIHELVQRTNQMNFSGHRYSKADLQSVLLDGSRQCYLIDATDKYGKYGYIGFAVVVAGEIPRVVDLAFSCRIQAKRVEHAVLQHLMEVARRRGASVLEVFYRKSERNAAVGQVFEDLGFEVGSLDGRDHVFRRSVRDARSDTSVVNVTADSADDASCGDMPVPSEKAV